MLSIILPAYNEENRIARSLDTLCRFMESAFPRDSYEILVVNDGSTDDTLRVVSACPYQNLRALSYEKNRGKGGAVKYGVEHAKGEIIIFTDSDLPYPPENIQKAARLFELEPYDLILGTREQTESGQKYPWYRSLMSRCFSLAVDAILKLHVPDTQCGFKCFRRVAAEHIFGKSTLTGWGFDVELIFLAKKQGLSIGRLPVELFHENSGSKIRVVHDALKMLREVRCIKENNQNGLYDAPPPGERPAAEPSEKAGKN